MQKPLFSFVHVTDTHHEVGAERLPRFVDIINSEKYFPLPDYVIHTGDIINGYKDTELLHRREMSDAKRIWDTLKPTSILTCHNHDTYSEPIRGVIYDEIFNVPHYQQIIRDGFCLIAFSGIVGTGKYLKSWRLNKPMPSDVERIELEDILPDLAEKLNENKDYKTLVFSHRGLPVRSPALNYPQNQLQAYNYISPGTYESFKDVLKSNGSPVAHYSGHVHVNAMQIQDGIHYITTASLLDYPAEFRHIEVFSDKIVHKIYNLGNDLRGSFRWGPLFDKNYPTTELYYEGNPEEREFVIDIRNI